MKNIHRPLVAITRQIPSIGMEMLRRRGFRVRLNKNNRACTREELKSFVKGASGMLSLLTDHIDGVVMDAAGSQLKIIANYAVGYDNIVLSDAKVRNIVVTNTPQVLNRSVAEHTIALMFACAKRIVEADRFTRAEQYQGWAPLLFLGTELFHKTLGIVGLGRIGSQVAQIARAGLSMKILYADVQRDIKFEQKYGARYKTLQQLLLEADVVTLHVPLLPSTRHLIGARALALMKKNAILINTSRGPIVDEKALTRALKNKKIFAAGIDVFECEPAIDCDVRDDLALKRLENVVLTPHIASATHEAREEMAGLAAKNIIRVLSGRKPISPVEMMTVL